MYKHFFWITLLSLITGCSQQPKDFAQIGVVEGFYGDPWSHEARLDLIRFMGQVDMNVYYYAPKDDPFHRSKWREPYEGEKLNEFRELLEVSKAAGVDLYFAISPGLDIVYSDSSDFAALQNKLQNMTELGVKHIALFLDDVPQKLQHERDKQNYGSLADAHVDLINKLWEGLKEKDIQLVVCPTTYTSAWGSREYLQKLGSGISEEIPLFWTGEDVAIAEITADETLEWGNLMNRKPLVWDNFPVNDYEGWRPILGPLTGRDTELPDVAKGIVANPMDLPYSSMIPLYTVADYGNDPENYDPEKSLESAIQFLAGEDAFTYVKSVVDLYSDYGWTDNVFTPIYTPGKDFDTLKIRNAIKEFETNLEALRTKEFSENMFVSAFVEEMSPFLEKTKNDFEEAVSHAQSVAKYNISFKVDWGNYNLAFSESGNQINVVLSTSALEKKSEWILILTNDENPTQTWLQPEDLIMRWDLGEAKEPRADHFQLTPFTQRGISDIQVRTITSFFEHFTVPAEVNMASNVRSTADSVHYTISIPKRDADVIRFNSFLNPDDKMISEKPYLGNPFTYPILGF
ncbi:protein O-GlcNAcase [Gracilimonas tropica]|uniref:protein O-GlcNAcase n=1 Tax=Gracilimonas tropica TaxID=454600 RepID=UPI0003640F58|nr:protein O-GlcNAcase [Gracilimonas tropica]